MGARVTTARAVVGLLVCVGLLAETPCAAQDAAALSGTVADPSGAVLPGVTVTVTDPRSAKRTVVTDTNGVFRVPGLEPGSYTVRAELSGFTAVERTVTVVSGRGTTIALVLEVASLAEMVTVTSEAPQVQASSSSRAYNPSGRMITMSLHGRSLGALTSGVSREAYRHIEETGFHRVSAHPRSTFSTDVDTASYTNVRRILQRGRAAARGRRADRGVRQLLPLRLRAASRRRAGRDHDRSGAPVRGTRDHLLALVGVRAADAAESPPRARPQPGVPARRVGIDGRAGQAAAGATEPALLADRLGDRDRIAMVVYAGTSGLALPSTSGDGEGRDPRRHRPPRAGGSTNGGARHRAGVPHRAASSSSRAASTA